MYCPKCGSQLPDGAAFCGNCGEKLAGSETSSTKTSEAVAIKKKNNPFVIIGVLVFIVLAALCVRFFACSNNSVYVIKEYESFRNGAQNMVCIDTRASDGTLTQVQIERENSDTITTEYKDLGDGCTIPLDSTGRFETNSNGDITYVEYTTSDDKKYINTYTYFKPGVRQSTKITSPSSETEYVYNEDGWLVSSKIKTDYSENSSQYEYSFSNNGKTAMRTTHHDGSSETSKKRFELDENGNIIEIYNCDDDEDVLIWKGSYEKVDNPAKAIAVQGRLKYALAD